ncbi:MAG: hypothetical protein ACRES3_04500 [Steroidobacteraceae bacterium]
MRRRVEDMEKDKDQPFAREPWQRLLQDRADSPPEMTDARIRAAARRALAPRAARWWLPASLAASLLLAVLIVQWQYGDSDIAPIVSESDLAARARMPNGGEHDAAAVADSSSMESVPNAQPARQAQVPRAEPDLAEEEFAPEPSARVGGPERDLKAASEVPAEEAGELAPPPVMDLPAQGAPAAAAQAEAAREGKLHAEARPDAPPGAAYTQTAAKLRKPEEWYAEIEKLRAAGRIEEANRELERLKAAHPGWLERHLQETERR